MIRDMTNDERWTYFESGVLQRITAIELLDWAGYWTTAGLDEITDPLQKEQTRQAIRLILTDLSYAIKVVASLAISDDAIRACDAGSVPEAVIHTVVVSIMANKLEWLTGVSELIAAE